MQSLATIFDLPPDVWINIFRVSRLGWRDLNALVLAHPTLYSILSNIKIGQGKIRLIRCLHSSDDYKCQLCVMKDTIWDTLHHYDPDIISKDFLGMVISDFLSYPHTYLMQWVAENRAAALEAYNDYAIKGKLSAATDIAIEFKFQHLLIDNRAILVWNEKAKVVLQLLSRRFVNRELFQVYVFLLGKYIESLSNGGKNVQIGFLTLEIDEIRNKVIKILPANAKFLYRAVVALEQSAKAVLDGIDFSKLGYLYVIYLTREEIFARVNLRAWKYAERLYCKIFGAAPTKLISKDDIATIMLEIFFSDKCEWNFYKYLVYRTVLRDFAKHIDVYELQNLASGDFEQQHFSHRRPHIEWHLNNQFNPSCIEYLLDPRIVAKTNYFDEKNIAAYRFISRFYELAKDKEKTILTSYLQSLPVVQNEYQSYMSDIPELCDYRPQNMAEYYALYRVSPIVRGALAYILEPEIARRKAAKLRADMEICVQLAEIAAQERQEREMQAVVKFDYEEVEEIDDCEIDDCEIDDCEIDDVEE